MMVFSRGNLYLERSVPCLIPRTCRAPSDPARAKQRLHITFRGEPITSLRPAHAPSPCFHQRRRLPIADLPSSLELLSPTTLLLDSADREHIHASSFHPRPRPVIRARAAARARAFPLRRARLPPRARPPPLKVLMISICTRVSCLKLTNYVSPSCRFACCF